MRKLTHDVTLSSPKNQLITQNPLLKIFQDIKRPKSAQENDAQIHLQLWCMLYGYNSTTGE